MRRISNHAPQMRSNLRTKRAARKARDQNVLAKRADFLQYFTRCFTSLVFYTIYYFCDGGKFRELRVLLRVKNHVFYVKNLELRVTVNH